MIQIVDKKYVGRYTNTTYRIKKKFVILTLDGFASYRHIKSGEIIHTTLTAPIGDFAINREMEFREKCPLLLRKLHLDNNSKISYNFISIVEDALNNGRIQQLENTDNITF